MINSSRVNLNSYFCSIFIVSIVVISLICSEALQIQQAKEPLRDLTRVPLSIRGPLTMITIQNDNDYLLGIHCKSKDDDLGFHILKQGELYGWKFHVNLGDSTLFFCGFSQGQDKKGVFEIYNSKRDFYRCKNCTWEAKKDGLYGYSNLPQTVIWFFKWLK
ncbi:putative plant self-incompatibility S1 [Arabidopsis thaliana]